MDKAEYKIATEHIKKLISQGEYAEASYIADTIDWRRVKSVMMLCTVSDLYKVNRRYQDAKELLYMAYERNPESRTILYSLCDLSIKLEEFVAAIEYYKSFVEVAPKDTGRYVLQYRLYQAQDVGLEERIEVLEQLKSEEYIEKWAYELAYLYHRIGFATRCVEECDELILWFGKGRYVYKAMELKMLHEPLTPYQQQIYENRFDHMEQAKDMTRVLPRIDSGDSAMTEEGMVDVTDAPTVEIPQEYLEKELHDTTVLPPEKVDDIQVKTLDVANVYNTMNLQKELADSLREILEVSHTESSVDNSGEAETSSGYADTSEITSEAVAETTEEVSEVSLEEDTESLEVISEQISIQQILPEAFRSTEPESVIIDKQITGQLSIDEVLDEWNQQEENTPVEYSEPEEAMATEELVYVEESVAAEEAMPVEEIIYAEESVTAEEAMPAEETIYEEQSVTAEEAMPAEEIVYVGETVPVEETVSEEPASEAVIKDESPETVAKENDRESTPKAKNSLINKSLYKEFIRVEDTETQICYVLENASMKATEGNVRVTGHDLSVCFELIKTLMADLKSKGYAISGKTAKISAVNLNKKEPSEIFNKLQGGALIIERAGRMRKETVDKLQQYLYNTEMSVMVFMTDTEQGMKHFVEKYPVMEKLFTCHINIKDYSEDELVEYAVKYAYDCEYAIDEMGQMALRTRIDELVANENIPTMAEARAIVEDAIERAKRKNMKHFWDIVFHKRYDSEDMIILREEDFLV